MLYMIVSSWIGGKPDIEFVTSDDDGSGLVAAIMQAASMDKQIEVYQVADLKTNP